MPQPPTACTRGPSVPRRVLLLFALGAALGPAHALVTVWDASWNQLPDQTSAGWVPVDSAATDPVLADGVLTLATSGGFGSTLFYRMDGAQLAFDEGAPYWMEATMRFVSGSHEPGFVRSPANMAFRFANGHLAVLEFRQDLIYVRNGVNSIGASAVVDTDDAFHTYRLVAEGSAAGSLLKVYQDGQLVLSDDAVYPAGSGALVYWGESSTLAQGRSEWQRVSHNMAAVASVPEPGSWAVMAGGLALIAGAAARRRA